MPSEATTEWDQDEAPPFVTEAGPSGRKTSGYSEGTCRPQGGDAAKGCQVFCSNKRLRIQYTIRKVQKINRQKYTPKIHAACRIGRPLTRACTSTPAPRGDTGAALLRRRTARRTRTTETPPGERAERASGLVSIRADSCRPGGGYSKGSRASGGVKRCGCGVLCAVSFLIFLLRTQMCSGRL